MSTTPSFISFLPFFSPRFVLPSLTSCRRFSTFLAQYFIDHLRHAEKILAEVRFKARNFFSIKKPYPSVYASAFQICKQRMCSMCKVLNLTAKHLLLTMWPCVSDTNFGRNQPWVSQLCEEVVKIYEQVHLLELTICVYSPNYHAAFRGQQWLFIVTSSFSSAISIAFRNLEVQNVRTMVTYVCSLYTFGEGTILPMREETWNRLKTF